MAHLRLELHGPKDTSKPDWALGNSEFKGVLRESVTMQDVPRQGEVVRVYDEEAKEVRTYAVRWVIWNVGRVRYTEDLTADVVLHLNEIDGVS